MNIMSALTKSHPQDSESTMSLIRFLEYKQNEPECQLV